MEIQIEFGGFYGFHDDYIVDRCDTLSIDTDDVNWHKTFVQYSVAWVHRFNMFCDLSLEFVGIDSPKFYNFTTDRIIAKVNNADINDLMLFIVDDEFKEWANPQLKSYDGFVSFYNGVDDLIERAKHDDDKAILLGMVCNYLIKLNEVNEDIYELEYDIIELNNKLVENESK